MLHLQSAASWRGLHSYCVSAVVFKGFSRRRQGPVRVNRKLQLLSRAMAILEAPQRPPLKASIMMKMAKVIFHCFDLKDHLSRYLLHCGTFPLCVSVRASPPKIPPSRGVPPAPSISSEMPTPVRSHHARQGTGPSTMDSSGYSSSEDPNRKPIQSAGAGSTGKSFARTLTGYRPRINTALLSLMGECEVLAYLSAFLCSCLFNCNFFMF